jgi:hypothetical protein
VNVEYFKYLYSVIKNDARGTLEIKFRVSMEKAAFNKNTTLFTIEWGLNLRKTLFKCYIWIIPLNGDETCTFQQVGYKYLGSCEMWS